jgi:hypothetical protein
LVRKDLEALADDEEDHDEQETLDNVHLLEEKEKLLPFLVTLTPSIWDGLVLVRKDIENLADDEV